MGKGEKTRCSVLNEALNLSSEVGLEALSFGMLAKRTGLSKSGLYAHFDSKEDLQCRVLDTAARRFVDIVLIPAIQQTRGFPRIEKLFELWLGWSTEELTGGCIFISAATEFDDREGPIKDHLIKMLREMLQAIARAAEIAVEEGHFRQDLDTEQFAYEFWANLLAYHHYQRLLGDECANRHAYTAFHTQVKLAQPVIQNK